MSHREFEYDQLTDLVSGEIDRQLRDRSDVVESMKSQMSKVLREFEDLTGNMNAKRSWMKSVSKNPRDIHPTNLNGAIHPLTTPGNIVTTSPTAAATSPSKLPTLSGLKARNKIQQKFNRNVFGPPPLVPGEGVPSDARSPDGKIAFDKKLPRVAHMEKKYDGMQTFLATQQKQQMYDRALVRYPQCRSKIYAPSLYDEVSGSGNSESSSATLPQTAFELDFVYGFHNGAPTTLSQSNVVTSNSNISGNVVYLACGEILWFTASLIVLYTKETNTQRYFREHTNEVTSVALHPNQHIVASGQAGRETFVLVWDSNDDILGKRFVCLKGHTVAVRSISFSHDGKLVASLGGDIYNTICIHDWRDQSLLVTARGHSFRVHTIAFNPFQAYGRPETKREKKPGQALQEDDVCYTLVSCGVRHIRFWTLTKTHYTPPITEEKEEFPFFGATFGGPPRQRPLSPHEKVWKLEGNIPSLNGKLDVQDFTCLTFVDDSPPLYVYDEQSKQLVATNANDRSLGRIIAGTAKGDLCVFWQPRKGPDIDTMTENDKEKEPAKWWEIPDEYSDAEIDELVLEKFLYEPTARLVEVVPHDQETGNKFKISKQAQLEIDTINKRLLMKQATPALHTRLAELKYGGPLGHQGCAHQLAFCKKNNLIISSGSDGRLVLWKCVIAQAMRVPGVSTQGIFTPLSGTFSDGMHSLTPLDVETKVYVLPSTLPGEMVSSGPPPKPTSLAWKEDGKYVIVGTSTHCIWELNIVSGEWNLVFEARNGVMVACSTHPTREEMATLCQDGYLTIWDLRRHACTRRAHISITNTCASAKATCMEFHPSGGELVIGLSTGELLIIAFQDLRVIQRKSMKAHTSSIPIEQPHSTPIGGGSAPSVVQIKYSPDGSLLAVGAKDTFIYIYQVSNGYKKVYVCEGHSSAVVHLTWGADGDVLQSNASDGEVLFWSIQVTQNSFKQITDSFQVRDIQWVKWTSVFGWATPGIWSEDSTNLVDIGALATSGPKRTRLPAGSGESVEHEPIDGEELVAVANRNTLRLFRWPVLRGAKGKSYHAHSSLIVSLGFSFNDQYIVTVGGEDCTLVQWKLIAGTGAKRKQKYRVSHNDDKDDDLHSNPVPPSSGKDLASPRSPRQVSRQYRKSHQEREDVGDDAVNINTPGDDEPTETNRTRVIIPTEPLSVIAQVQSKHDFAAENADELNMKEGELIRVLSKENDDWWLGESCDGTRGIFPSNFVEDVSKVDDEETTHEEDVAPSSNEEETHAVDEAPLDVACTESQDSADQVNNTAV